MKIIQITDSHIHQNPKNRLFGLINTEDTLLDVLESVKQENPDIVLATGDLSQDGSVESYQRLNSYFRKLNCDVYTVYGNHDNPINFNKWLIGNNVKNELILKAEIGNFIFLSSYKPNSNSGYIDESNLAHLTNSLKLYDNCIPVIHHHFVPLGSTIDDYVLENNGQLIEVLKHYKSKIRFCITGHVHNSYQVEFEGIKIYSSLSTCIQFAKTRDFLFENKRPGYTAYNFYKNHYEVIERTL